MTPTASADAIYRQACQLFDELWNGEPIRLLGIRTTKLEDEGEPVQINLFDYQREQKSREKQQKLDAALDSIRKRFGDGAIRRGDEFENL